MFLSVIEGRRIGKFSTNELIRTLIKLRTQEIDIKSSWTNVPHTGPINCLDVEFVDNRYVLSGGSDCQIVITDSLKNEVVTTIDKGKGHKFAVTSVCWYPCDTGMFLSAGFDETVVVWDTNTSKKAIKFPLGCHVYQISMSQIASSHALVAVATKSRTLRLCDLRTGTSTHCLLGHQGAIFSTHWSPSCEYLLSSGSEDMSILLWDIRKSNFIMSFDAENHQKTTTDHVSKERAKSQTPFRSHTAPVCSLCFSPDGFQLYSLASDGRISAWDTVVGGRRPVNFPKTRPFQLKSKQMGMSRYGDYIFVPNKKDVDMFETSTGKKIKTLKAHLEQINCCSYNHWSETLFTCGDDRQIIEWYPREKVLQSNDENNWNDSDPE
eukprot:c13868_g1_i2.p1 GENE.c13868_g1_i2~~c13868_g1_i2.p1  ORF type:complete len:396 (+),score=141.78 c13868_g1_i2:54-1190(+)